MFVFKNQRFYLGLKLANYVKAKNITCDFAKFDPKNWIYGNEFWAEKNIYVNLRHFIYKLTSNSIFITKFLMKYFNSKSAPWDIVQGFM